MTPVDQGFGLSAEQRNAMAGAGKADTAEVNVPLHKRYGKGGLAAEAQRQVAKDKREREAATKAARNEHQLLRAEAKALVSAMPDAQIAPLTAKAGLTVKAGRASLMSRAHFDPGKLVESLRRAAQDWARRCELCACWRKVPDGGECWAPDRLDDISKGPAGYPAYHRTCEVFRARGPVLPTLTAPSGEAEG